MKDFYKKTGCLSAGQLLHYLGQKMEPAESRDAELHLAECPFCSDALDGFMKRSGLNKVSDDLSDISRKVGQRVQGKKNSIEIIALPLLSLKRKSARYAIAASIILLAVAGIIINMYLKKSVDLQKTITEQVPLQDQKNIPGKPAEERNEETAGETESIDKTEQPMAGTKSSRTAGAVESQVSGKTTTDRGGYLAADEMKEENIPKSAAGASTVLPLETAESKPTAVPPPQPSATTIHVPAAEPQKGAEGDLTESELAQTRGVAEEPLQTQDNKKGKTVEKKKNETVAAPGGGKFQMVVADAALASGEGLRDVSGALDSAIAKYDARDYDGSLSIIETRVFAQEKYNYDGLFYAGMANVQKDSCHKAVEYFNRMLQMKSLKHYHEALFNKAQCLMKMNRKEEARKALEELSARENRYRKPAMDMLEEINK